MAMLPEVEKFLADRETVSQATRAAYRDLETTNPWRYTSYNMTEEEMAAVREANRERERLADLIEQREKNGRDKALEGLRASSLPVVVFMANHCADYMIEMQDALKALTLDGDNLAELDAAAAEHAWCNVWTRFRRQMLAEGVLSEARPAYSKVHRALVSRGWSTNNVTISLAELVNEEISRRRTAGEL